MFSYLEVCLILIEKTGNIDRLRNKKHFEFFDDKREEEIKSLGFALKYLHFSLGILFHNFAHKVLFSQARQTEKAFSSLMFVLIFDSMRL